MSADMYRPEVEIDGVLYRVRKCGVVKFVDRKSVGVFGDEAEAARQAIRPAVDDLKLARDGHLWHGPKVEPPPVFDNGITVERGPDGVPVRLLIDPYARRPVEGDDAAK